MSAAESGAAVYAGREPAASWGEAEALARHVLEHGTDPALSGGAHPAGAEERATRLRVAAYADRAALTAEAGGTAELAAEMANVAILLSWHLRDYDRRYGTGAAVVPGPGDLSWEAAGLARAYTRAAWLALHTGAEVAR